MSNGLSCRFAVLFLDGREGVDVGVAEGGAATIVGAGVEAAAAAAAAAANVPVPASSAITREHGSIS